MRGRLPTQRQTPPGPHPDWREVRWYVYDDLLTVNRRQHHCYRVSPRALTDGERRRFERLVAVVRGTSLKRVRQLLRDGHAAGALQGIVNRDAACQVARTILAPNTYAELVERLRPKGAARDAEEAA